MDVRYPLKILGLLLLIATPSYATPFEHRFSCVVLELSPRGEPRHIETLEDRDQRHVIGVALERIQATARWHPTRSLGTIDLALRTSDSRPHHYHLQARLTPHFPIGIQVQSREGIFALDCHLSAKETTATNDEVFVDASTVTCQEGRQTRVLPLEGGDNNLRATLPAPLPHHHATEVIYHPISARLSLGFPDEPPITQVRLIGRATEDNPLRVRAHGRQLTCFTR
jgi:hypothetical protein